jgi:hypothetical protein
MQQVPMEHFSLQELRWMVQCSLVALLIRTEMDILPQKGIVMIMMGIFILVQQRCIME